MLLGDQMLHNLPFIMRKLMNGNFFVIQKVYQIDESNNQHYITNHRTSEIYYFSKRDFENMIEQGYIEDTPFKSSTKKEISIWNIYRTTL